MDAVVHAVNEDYQEMAGDFMRLGFLTPGTDITPIVPALEKIWRDSRGQSLADFNFRCVGSCPAAAMPLLQLSTSPGLPVALAASDATGV